MISKQIYKDGIFYDENFSVLECLLLYNSGRYLR